MGGSASVAIGRYLLGAVALAVICASLGLSAVAIRRRVLADWTGAPARLAESVIGLTILIGVLELLGTVGLFAFAPIVIACVLVGLASLRSASVGCGAAGPKGEAGMPSGPSPRPPGRPVRTLLKPGVATVIALLGAAVVIAEWGALSIQSYDVGIRGFDSLWYHLPWAASFAQTGNVASLRFTDVEYLTPFYPATAEMLHGLGIVLLGRDTLSPGFNLLWLALTLLAAYCIGRPRGVGAATLLGAAVALATTMMDYSQAGAAANDVVAVFFLLAAVALYLNGALVLAAVAAGLAVGVKLTVLAPVLALTVGVIAIAPTGQRSKTAGRWLGPLILAGGFWYLRNLIAVGNPLPWTSLHGVLPAPTPALQQHTGFSVAHYLTTSGFWSHFVQPALAAGLGRWWWAIVATAVLGPLLCLLPHRGSGRDYVHAEVSSQTRMLGAVALFSLAAYLITPETAAGPSGDPLGFAFNLRYLAPALTLSLAVAPLAPPLTRTPAVRAAIVISLAALLAATVAQPRLWPDHTLGAILIGAAAVVLLALTRVRLALAAALLALLVALYPLQTHYLRNRYVYHPNVSSLAHVWAMFRTIHDARVGVVGTFGGFFAYPLAGLDDSNRVQYVADRGAHGSFTPIGTCARWRARVNAAHLNYLITTPARDPWHPRVLSPSPETGWTAGDPAAQPIYREQALGQPIVVYRIRGPLNPGSCG
ncbi:MAG TPA: hypothetical protein VFH80_03655 [Solirubrobacteraceae bacterium]|nr:hypothetical protein [Solirubrobacteraceae bacterium]